MRVAELMQTNLESVSVETPANDALVTLAESRVSALPVMDSAGRLVGVFSRTDVLASEEETVDQAAREALFEDRLVQDLMSAPALTITPDASIREAAQRMLTAGVHRLFVVSQEAAVGVISITDIVQAVADGRLSPSGRQLDSRNGG